MLHKVFVSLVVIGFVFTTGSIAAYSQFAALNGKIFLEKNGTKEPVAGALVQPYRVDIKSTAPVGTTNKKGEFVFAGLPFGGIYILAVSADGCAPQVFPNFKVGNQDNITVILSPGDGKRLTEDEARKAAAESFKGGGGDGTLTEEQKAQAKKSQEEYEKKRAEIEEKNKKIKEGDAAAVKANEAGFAATRAGDYDTAVAQYDQGIAAVPDVVSITPILIRGKMEALKLKGFKLRQEGAALTDHDARKAKYDDANKYFDQGLAAFDRAMAIYKAAEAPATPDEGKQRDSIKVLLYSTATEIHRLKIMGGVDQSKAGDAFTVISTYITIETDPAKKFAAQMALGDVMRVSGDFDRAIAAYRKVLEVKTDYPDALGSLGLCLFAQGSSTVPEDKVKEQEGLNYMQKYTEVAPITAADSPSVKELKQSVKDSVDYLKSQKFTPQKLPKKP